MGVPKPAYTTSAVQSSVLSQDIPVGVADEVHQAVAPGEVVGEDQAAVLPPLQGEGGVFPEDPPPVLGDLEEEPSTRFTWGRPATSGSGGGA